MMTFEPKEKGGPDTGGRLKDSLFGLDDGG